VTGPLVAIVADDLTGAGDTAVQFVRAGWVTQLSMGGADEALSGAGARAEVLAVTTNSRAMAPAAAGEAVRREGSAPAPGRRAPPVQKGGFDAARRVPR